MTGKKKYTLEEIREQVVEFMEKKYGEKFEVESMGNAYLFSLPIDLTLRSLSNPKFDNISARWTLEDKKVVITDGYASSIIERESYEFLSDTINEYFPTERYHFFGSIRLNSNLDYFDDKMSVNDHLKSDVDYITITMFLIEDDDIDTKQKLELMIADIEQKYTSGGSMSVLTFIADRDKFYHDIPLFDEFKQTLDMKSLEGDASSSNVIRSYYYLTQNGEIEIREGR